MNSKIRIEFDFETNQPVLRINQGVPSDDLRDSMLKAFVEKASHPNSVLYLTYPEYKGRTDNGLVEIRCEIGPETN